MTGIPIIVHQGGARLTPAPHCSLVSAANMLPDAFARLLDRRLGRGTVRRAFSSTKSWIVPL
jgi:hypothetical protein